MHILFPLTIILIFSSRYLFRFFYTETFEPSSEIFNILLMLIVSRTIFPQSVLIGLQKTNLIFKASIFEFSANLILCLVLTPLIGVKGAALGVVISYYINTLILVFFVHQNNIRIRDYSDYRLWLLYSVIGWIVLILV
jgi:O-antigen/teichoic acid export membrane protein